MRTSSTIRSTLLASGMIVALLGTPAQAQTAEEIQNNPTGAAETS
jgi:hypothetical protein